MMLDDDGSKSSPLQRILLQPDGNVLKASVLRRERSVVTLRDGDAALQLPLKYGLAGPDGTVTEEGDGTVEMSYESLQREEEVNQRLDHHDDVGSIFLPLPFRRGHPNGADGTGRPARLPEQRPTARSVLSTCLVASHDSRPRPRPRLSSSRHRHYNP